MWYLTRGRVINIISYPSIVRPYCVFITKWFFFLSSYLNKIMGSTEKKNLDLRYFFLWIICIINAQDNTTVDIILFYTVFALHRNYPFSLCTYIYILGKCLRFDNSRKRKEKKTVCYWIVRKWQHIITLVLLFAGNIRVR